VYWRPLLFLSLMFRSGERQTTTSGCFNVKPVRILQNRSLTSRNICAYIVARSHTGVGVLKGSVTKATWRDTNVLVELEDLTPSETSDNDELSNGWHITTWNHLELIRHVTLFAYSCNIISFLINGIVSFPAPPQMLTHSYSPTPSFMAIPWGVLLLKCGISQFSYI